MPRKSQVSFEVLIVLAIGMLVGAPLLMYANREGRGSHEAAAASGMDQLCGAIVERAAYMKSVGRESWSTLKFRAHAPITGITPSSAELELKVEGPGGPQNIVCYSSVPLRLADSGRDLNGAPLAGTVELKLQYMRGYVCLGAADGDCSIGECEDGLDNDGNLCADHPRDTGCASPADTTEQAGQCDPGICGNLLVEPPEDCDRDNLGGERCETIGYNGGVLGCYPDCSFDVSRCHRCGDGAQQAGEECDEGGATNGCNADCTRTRCGDGRVQTPNWAATGGPANDGYEACDDGANGDNTDACTDLCTWTFCGDGTPQAQNGAHAGGASGTGDEECDEGVAMPTSRCVDCRRTRCGDNIVQTPDWFGVPEECDGTAQPLTQCTDLVAEGWLGGALGCVAPGQPTECRYDRSLCDRCGNGVLDAGELCDPGPPVQLNNQNCGTIGQGFRGGTLGCTGTCTWDTSNCNHCGDSTIDVAEGEVCDPPGSHTGPCSPILPSQSCTADCRGCWEDTCRPITVTQPLEGDVDPLYYSPPQDDMDSVTMDSGGFILAAERGAGVRRFQPPTQAGTCNNPRYMDVPTEGPSLISGTSGTGARRMDVDNQGRIYLSLKNSGIVRVLRPDYSSLGSISMGSVRNVAVDYTRGFVYLSDLSTIRQYQENAGPSWSYTGNSWSGSNLDDLAFVPPDHLLISEERSRFRIMNLNTYVIERSISGGFEGLTSDRWGNALVVDAQQNRLEVYSVSTGQFLAYIQNACNDFNDMDDVHIDVDSRLLLTADQTNLKVVAMPAEDVLSVYLECVPPDCNDGIQNQDETMMDCGGVCCDTLGVCPPGC